MFRPLRGGPVRSVPTNWNSPALSGAPGDDPADSVPSRQRAGIQCLGLRRSATPVTAGFGYFGATGKPMTLGQLLDCKPGSYDPERRLLLELLQPQQ